MCTVLFISEQLIILAKGGCFNLLTIIYLRNYMQYTVSKTFSLLLLKIKLQVLVFIGNFIRIFWPK